MGTDKFFFLVLVFIIIVIYYFDLCMSISDNYLGFLHMSPGYKNYF